VSLHNGRSAAAASCMAATGGIRAARIAGSSAAAIVTRMPTANAASTAETGTANGATATPPPR
jgi:hypothetical protein